VWEANINGVALAADGRHVYVGAAGTDGITVLDADDGSVVTTFGDVEMNSHAVAIATDGRYLAAVKNGDDTVIHIYNKTAAPAWTHKYSINVDAPAGPDSWGNFTVSQGALYIEHMTALSVGSTRKYRLHYTAGGTLEWSQATHFLFRLGEMSADASRLYVANPDRDNLEVFGSPASVFALSAQDGSEIWRRDYGVGKDAEATRHSSRYVAAIVDGLAVLLDPATGASLPIESAVGSGAVDALLCMDEVSIHARSTDDDSDLIRFWLGQPPPLTVADDRDAFRINPHRVIPV